MADDQQRRVQRSQVARRLQVLLLVERRHRGEREAPVVVVGDRYAAVAREHITRDQRPVARIEERNVAGRVTGARDDLEAADAVAWLQPDIGHGR